jgi:hypothetical protein
MSLPARVSFAQIGILLSTILYIATRGFLVMLNVGLLWTQVGGFLLIVLPLPAVIVLGFAACVVSYSFSYLGLWMMDNDFYLPGVIMVFLAVIIVPICVRTYSWFAFTLFIIV